MCGRYTLTVEKVDELADLLDAEVEAADKELHRPRFNLAPTDDTWVLVDEGGRRLERGRWGWGVALINYRTERLASSERAGKPRSAQPCLVPADGFYEWRGDRKQRQPIWFHRPDRQLMTFAGLYHPTEHGPSFVILTVPANDLVRAVHDRMPAILDAERGRTWLATGSSNLLVPASPSLLEATPVSERVNSVAHDDVNCLQPPVQTTLF